MSAPRPRGAVALANENLSNRLAVWEAFSHASVQRVMRRRLTATLFALGCAWGCSEHPAVSPTERAPSQVPLEPAQPSDVTAPSFAEDASLHADATGALDEVPRAVSLHWPAAQDDVGVVAYLIEVDDADPIRIAPAEEHRLESVAFASAHVFRVRAEDAAGNVSRPLETDDALSPRWTEPPRVELSSHSDAFTVRWGEAHDDRGVTAYVLQGEEEAPIAELPPSARSFAVDAARARRTDAPLELIARDAAGHKLRFDLRVAFDVARLAAVMGGAADEALLQRAAPPSDDLERLMLESPSVGVDPGSDILRAAPAQGGLRRPNITSLRSHPD